MHSSFLSVWSINHNGIRRKPTENAVLENTEHEPMSRIEIRSERRRDSLLGLNLMEEYKSLLHDARAKGIREVTQPDEENSLTG
jgi:hypothetical protein